MKRPVLFIFCILTVVLTTAQPICHIKEYTVNDGLLQDIVSGIIQDKKGFMWFSTWNGLNKFDGYTFKNYKSSPHQEHTLSNNRIIFIAETTFGDIWCQSYDSKVYIFDTHNEMFFDVLQPVEKEMQRNSIVEKVYPLPKGVAWITCEKGYSYRVDEQKYKEKEGISLYGTYDGSLKGEVIFNIFQDSEGDEWILTDEGISIVGDKTIDSDFPFKLINEYNGKIYLISTSDKLAYYDLASKKMKFANTPAHIKKINSFKFIRNNLLAMATNSGVVLYDVIEDTFRTIDIRSYTHPSNEAISIYEDKFGELWTISATDPGTVHINLETGKTSHLYTPEKEVIDYKRENLNIIFEDKQGTLWVLPPKGNLSYYDRKEKRLKAFYTDMNNPQSLFAPLVRHYFEDRQRNVWLTSTRGVRKISFYSQVFNLNRLDHGFETRAFLLDRHQRLWVATKSGHIRIYDPNGTLIGYLSPQGHITQSKVEFWTNAYCFSEDKNGVILIGTKTNGLFRLNPKTNESYTIQHFVHNEEDAYSLSYNDIFNIFIDSKQNTWIGCYGGGLNLMKEDANGKVQFINYKNKLKNYPFNTASNIRYITEADKGVILLGTTSGLITFSNDYDKPEEIKFNKNYQKADKPNGLIGNDIMHIYIDSRKDIYLMAFSAGVNKVLSKDLLNENIEFKYYTTQEGLHSDLVMSMIEDNSKNLWIVTENGLTKFNPQKETFEIYSTKFFQQQMNFTESPPTVNAKHQLTFGTDIGFLEIFPEQIKKNNYIPPIVFTDLKINGEQTVTSVDNLKGLDLKPSERNITINFSALDYVAPEDINYAYQLEGLDKQWNYSEKSRSASYINLPAGEYKLHIKSTNSDGVWVDNIRTLSIKVLPTFWETPWAWIVYLIAFILFTCAIVYVLFYIYRLRHQVDMEQQLSNIKLRFFTDISHELRTPLTLISTPVNEVLENEPLSGTAREHLTLVHKNTERMLRLVNQILDFRKIQNKKMKILAEETELIGFVQKVTESFKLVADEKQIVFCMETDMKELYIWIDRDKVEKIIFNLLSNAFKYTLPRKSVKIRIEANDKDVFIRVIDEGIGIPEEKQESLFNRFETIFQSNILQPSSGIGLSMVKELVEMHHGNIEMKSQPGMGSEFRVTLPLKRDILEKDKQVEFILADSRENNGKLSGETEGLQPDEQPNEEITPETEDNFAILIVEDNPELKKLLRNILSNQYTILEASNGEEGLAEALQSIPDMIISDIMMPVMDGLEMVRLIKENKDTCHIPVILLSAKSSLDDRIKGLEHGIDDYITKPFSSTYLKTRIASLFTQRKLLQASFLEKFGGSKSETMNLEPSKPNVPPYDEMFMKQVMEIMEEQIDNPELTIDDFADKLFLSRSLFYRKLKSIVGLTPVDFIRDMRLKRATQLIDNNMYNISQIAYMTGFNDPKYFSKCFKRYTGLTPREYKTKNNLD